MKAALGHGRFLAWIEAEFGMSTASADRFMRVAERIGPQFVTLTNLPVTVLYELAAPSTPDEVREAVVERAAAGEKVTAAMSLDWRHEIAGLSDIMNVRVE